MFTLHVTNGDFAAQGLARSGLPGDVLAWRDVLHDGPVPLDDHRPLFYATRARFLAERRWANEADIVRDLLDRDARLDGVRAPDAIVLWFEPDLYDQLQLIQVLSHLWQCPAAERPFISIVPADLLLGALPPEKFRPLYDLRRSITDEDLARGRLAWEAFTSSTPEALLAAVEGFARSIPARTYAADDHERLPHLTAALRRALEEYPDAETGLSRSERQICEALMPGATTLGKLYQMSHHVSESWVWLGDWSFAWYVERLGEGSRPLVTHPNGTRVLAPTSGADARLFWERTVTLTPFGHDVVRARADSVAENGIDRWIGGVRLTNAAHWRWDERTQQPIFREVTP
jgi:hypothetical protein